MLNPLRKWMINQFAFSKKETNGILVLLALLTISLIIVIVLPFIFNSSDQQVHKDSEKLENFLLELESNILQNNADSLPLNLNEFNPNVVTKADWLTMGLPENIVTNLIKYREKGGHFYRKDQFRKIYGLTDSLYNLLEPYIVLTEAPNSQKVTTDEYSRERPYQEKQQKHRAELPSGPAVLMDLNKADTVQLKQVYGIGSVLSARIIKYKKLLGGYVSVEQLNEVYGLKEPALENLRTKVYIEESYQPAKISINFSSAYELSRHPYISYDLAGQIVQFRSQNGLINDSDQLISSGKFKEEELKKVLPYLKYD